MSVDIQAARLRAFHNAVEFIDGSSKLPSQVFAGEWAHFRVFESDTIILGLFVGIIRDLLRIEGSSTCCVLNVSQSVVLEYQEAAMFYIEQNTSENEYTARLKEGEPFMGWIYNVDRYVCVSDIGEWCIHCERQEDIALIGFRHANALEKYAFPIEEIRTESIEDIGKKKPKSLFSNLTDQWRGALVKHYGVSRKSS